MLACLIENFNEHCVHPEIYSTNDSLSCVTWTTADRCGGRSAVISVESVTTELVEEFRISDTFESNLSVYYSDESLNRTSIVATIVTPRTY